jgi:hypothetical protein
MSETGFQSLKIGSNSIVRGKTYYRRTMLMERGLFEQVRERLQRQPFEIVDESRYGISTASTGWDREPSEL